MNTHKLLPFVTAISILCSTLSIHVNAQPQDIDVELDQPPPPEARIVGGVAANTNELPWQAAILSDTDAIFDSQGCGGTIIDESWVLTAAHCFDSQTPRTFVGVGFIDLNNSSTGFIYEVAQWFLHPNYDDITLDNDIALIELSTPIDFGQCGDACLAIDTITTDNEQTEAAIGTNVTISGWGSIVAGLDQTHRYPTELRLATVQLVGCLDAPSDFTSQQITDNMICASNPDYSKDSCQGDSGGPMVLRNQADTATLLAGVTSWGNGCAVENSPGVYTRVANYTEWINTVQAGNGCCAASVSNAFQDDDGGGSFSLLSLIALLLLTPYRYFSQRHGAHRNASRDRVLHQRLKQALVPLLLLFTLSGCSQSLPPANQPALQGGYHLPENTLNKTIELLQKISHKEWQLSAIDQLNAATPKLTLDNDSKTQYYSMQINTALPNETDKLGNSPIMGEASGQVACNRWKGKAEFHFLNVNAENAKKGASEPTLTVTIHPTGTTRKRCFNKNAQLQPIANQYMQQLSRSHTVAMIDQQTLRLSPTDVSGPTWYFVIKE